MHQDEDFFEEDLNIYNRRGIKEALDADEISAEEEGFLQGYDEAYDDNVKTKRKEELNLEENSD